jgi:hypothetical protein
METVIDSLRMGAIVISDPAQFASDIAAPLHKIHEAGAEDTFVAWCAFWVAVFGVVIAVGAAVFTYYIPSRRRKELEQGALKGVMEDLLRHFKMNQTVCHAIDLDTGIPSSIHFRRMKVDDNSLVFDLETHKNIRKEYFHHFNRLRLNYRNSNIDLEAACNYLDREDYDKAVMKNYLAVVLERQQKLQRLTYEFLDMHYNGKFKEIPTRKKTDTILYEKLY